MFYTSVTVFYWKNKYAKILNGDVHGTSRDPVAGRPGDQMMGRSGDVPGMSNYMFFKFNSETYLTYFDRLLETL